MELGNTAAGVAGIPTIDTAALSPCFHPLHSPVPACIGVTLYNDLSCHESTDSGEYESPWNTQKKCLTMKSVSQVVVTPLVPGSVLVCRQQEAWSVGTPRGPELRRDEV